MQMRQRLFTSLISLLVLLLPAYGYHIEGKSSSSSNDKDQYKRQVRAAEAAPIQPQQDQSGQDLMAEPDDGGSRSNQLLSLYPSYLANRYYLPHSSLASYPTAPNGAKWLSGFPLDLPRAGRADSNFIRFGRSVYPGIFRTGSKKNNFIRLGRENPRQNNFIRLGRSGSSWDNYDRVLPKVGFFPDYYYGSTSSPSSGYHWSRFTDDVTDDTTN